MRIIEPQQFQYKVSQTKQRKKTKLRLYVSVILLLPVVYGIWAYRQPIPTLLPHEVTINTKTEPVNLAWPKYGQSAIGANGYGVLATNGTNKPVPMASVAKVMLALAIMRAKPFAVGQPGATITLTSDDVALYDNYAAQGGSVVAVEEGEELTQYQALQALLLASANNIADTLARWAFGSMEGYLQYSNDLAKTLKLTNTHFADASGFSAQTVSTAADLVILGQAALANPVIAQIVSQKEATIPVAGAIQNVNYLLGQNGIVGIKTGNTEEAGGCYLFAAVQNITGGQPVTIVGAIMGASSLSIALRDVGPLLTSTTAGFGARTVVHANQTIGYYDVPWGERVNIVAQKDLSVFGWKATATKISVDINATTVPQESKQFAGIVKAQATVDSQQGSAVTGSPISTPKWYIRFLHRW